MGEVLLLLLLLGLLRRRRGLLLPPQASQVAPASVAGQGVMESREKGGELGDVRRGSSTW